MSGPPSSFRPARTPFVSRSRVDAVSRARARADWVRLLERAAEVGALAAEGEDLGKDQAITFAGLVIQASRPPFPLPYASATAAAAGFRELARGFVTSAQPGLRRLLGAAMAQAARCCRGMIQLDDDEQAAAWRRRTGESDD